MKKTIVVNLIGAPCAGKSTLAALTFSKLKMQNVSCEIVTEFAKDLVWSESNGLNNQIYVFGEQFYRVWKLQNKVDVIITDSPMLLSIYYNKHQTPENRLSEENFNSLIMECHNKYINLNYFLQRHHKYDVKGRVHSEKESDQIEQEMKALYDNMNIKYTTVFSSEDAADRIVEDVKNLLTAIAEEE